MAITISSLCSLKSEHDVFECSGQGLTDRNQIKMPVSLQFLEVVRLRFPYWILSSLVNFGNLSFLGNNPFLLGFQICWNEIEHRILFIFLIVSVL